MIRIACMAIVLSLVLGGALGCQTTGFGPAEIAARQGAIEPQASAQIPRPLILGPGDVIEVKFTYASQFNESQTVRPDGVIDLQLVGPINVTGKTVEQLRNELTALYAEQLKHPELVIIVRSFYARRVYVGGAVKNPGVIEMPSRLTALEAIMQAGGFNSEEAHIENVVVVRDGKREREDFLLDFSDSPALAESVEFELEPRDIVYVPRTKIVRVNQWVKQHIYNFLPPFTTFGLGYSF